MIRLKYVPVAQKVALTLTELCELDNSFFLFEFTSDTTKESFVLPLADTSTNKSRFNLFEFLLSYFPAPGWYSYRAYEQDTLSNTDISLTYKLVEEGRLFIESEGEPIQEYNSEIIYKEYEQ